MLHLTTQLGSSEASLEETSATFKGLLQVWGVERLGEGETSAKFKGLLQVWGVERLGVGETSATFKGLLQVVLPIPEVAGQAVNSVRFTPLAYCRLPDTPLSTLSGPEQATGHLSGLAEGCRAQGAAEAGEGGRGRGRVPWGGGGGRCLWGVLEWGGGLINGRRKGQQKRVSGGGGEGLKGREVADVGDKISQGRHGVHGLV